MRERDLPKGWVLKKFTDALDIQGGTQPPKSTFIYAPKKNYIRLLQIRDFGEKPQPTYVPFRSQLKTCKESDILIARYGASIGRIVTGMEGAYNVALTKVIVPPDMEARYVSYLLKSEIFQRPILSIQRSAQDGFNKEDLSHIEIPIAPFIEQKQIVAKLDALMERVNANKKRLEKIPQILKRFRQAVLDSAIRGGLTTHWRERNKCEVISLEDLNQERESLQKVNSEKKGQKSFKYKQPVEIEIGERSKGVDELFDLPETWKWASLDKCAWSISDGPHYSPSYVEKEKGIAFISSRNISYSNIDFSDAKYVSAADHKEFIRRGKPENGDILLTKGGTTGIAHKINTKTEFSIWVHVALIKVIKKHVVSDYLRDVLTSDFLYRQSQAQTHGVGNQDLGLTRMIFMTIPLPPVAEQKEIVRRVNELFGFADKIEARFTKAKDQLDKLPQSILAKAFRGELLGKEETISDSFGMKNYELEEELGMVAEKMNKLRKK